MHRLLDRLTSVPLVGYDAAWNLAAANAPYDAHGLTAQEHAEQVSRLVADLHLTALRYPRDGRLRRLVAELHAASPRFIELWEATPDPAPADQSRHKVIEHPAVGPITLDCDTLVVTRDDLRIMAYTAKPDTENAQRLELAIVLGTQSLVE